MYCRSCGKKLDDQVRFCNACGARVITIDERQKLAAQGRKGSEPELASAAVPAPEAVGTSTPIHVTIPAFAPEPLAVQPSVSAGVLRSPYNVIAAVLFGIAAALYLMTCVLIQQFPLNYALPAVVCVAAAALCYLRHPILAKALPAWAIVEFVVSVLYSLWFYVHFGALYVVVSLLPLWLLNAAYVTTLTLVCLDRIKNRKAGALTLVVIAVVMELFSHVLEGVRLRNMLMNGLPVGYMVTWTLTVLFVTAGQTLVAYVLEQSREPGGVWRKAPSVAVGNASSGMPDGDYARYPHPYHELGGWLKAIVIMGYVGVALTILSGVIAVAALVYLSSRSLGGSGAIIMGAGAVILVAVVATCAFLLVFLGKIRRKDPTFLRDYHLFFIVPSVFILLGMVISRSFDSLPSLLSAWIIMGVYTLYFVKSVRVRTYMGSDAYLRLSPLVKGVQSPMPADTVPYQGQQ